jgi:alanyl-tRNA synthetase
LRYDIAFRVIADHVRCLTFALTDGAVPSNEGRGYVLRRILRRTVFWYSKYLSMPIPSLYRLVPVIAESMGGAFPELKIDPSHVAEIIRNEEIGFGRTLDRGIQLFELAAEQAKFLAIGEALARKHDMKLMWVGGHVWSESESDLITDDFRNMNFTDNKTGEVRTHYFRDEDMQGLGKIPSPMIRPRAAFKLHDTYGFPIDLTRIMAEERGMTVDIAGYEKLMEQAKELARSGGKGEASKLTDLPPAALSQLAQTGVKPTDDKPKFSHGPIQAKVMAIWNGDDLGLSPASVFEDQQLAIILDKTNFYAEMGGQVGDTGTLTGLAASAASIFTVENTKTVAGYTLHIGRLESGKIKVGDSVTVTVSNSRTQTEKNHTTTHVTNWALREVLGNDVQQKGSLVDPEKLRFDFSHGKAIADSELEKIESLVHQAIEKNLKIYAEEAPQELALKINGLRAVFGEKYPPMVRVVSIGAPVKDLLADPTNEKWRQYSIEFCGGTHLQSTDQAESFTIIAEESVSKGIRRLTALTGLAASAASESASKTDAIITTAKSTPDDQLQPILANLNAALSTGTLPLRAKRRAQAAIAELQARIKAHEKSTRASATKVDAIALAADLLASAPTCGPGKLIVGEIPGADDEQLRTAMNSLAKKSPSHGIMLAAVTGDRITFVAAVSDDLIAKGLKAGDWIRETAKIAGGGGGGKPNMAQAGGKDPAKLGEALEKARRFAIAIAV